MVKFFTKVSLTLILLTILLAMALAVVNSKPAQFPKVSFAQNAPPVAVITGLNMAQINKGKLPPVIPLPEIGVGLSDALVNHTQLEVDTVRNCIKNNGGAMAIFRETYFDDMLRKRYRFHLLCVTSDFHTAVDQIVEKINGVWEEVTAFIPKDGTVAELETWLGSKIGQIWTGGLP